MCLNPSIQSSPKYEISPEEVEFNRKVAASRESYLRNRPAPKSVNWATVYDDYGCEL